METPQQRDYQERVIAKSIAYFEGEDKSVIVESPTGSGKTVMGLAIANYAAQRYGFRTSWMAMRRNLLNQVKAENDRFYGNPLLTPVSMFDRNPPEADLLVVDEAQHDAADSAVNIHKKTKPKWILGLTATPFRTDKMRLAFSRHIKDAGIYKLISDGYLAQFHQYAMTQYTPRSVARVFLEDPAKWGKTVVFFHKGHQCLEFMRHLRRAGIRAEFVTHADPFQRREEILDRFDAGEVQVLVNIMILTEGFDAPNLQTVFVRDSAKLPTIQMAGRGLRIAPGKEYVNIVQSTQTPWPFTRTARPEQSFVQRRDQWLQLDGNSGVLEQTAQDTLMALASAPAIELPPWLAQQNLGGRRGRRHRRAERED